MEKLHLKGETESPDGRAPLAGWKAVEEAVKRPEDAWLQGNPLTLLSQPSSWQERIRARIENPAGVYGLRLRFVFQSTFEDSLDLASMVSEVLTALPESSNNLFIHAEIMEGPESGLYVAFENRPPALLTQLHLNGSSVEGQLIALDEARPLHLNILLHDQEVGFHRALKDGTLPRALSALREMVGANIEVGRIHELSIARSDSRPTGISVGLEAVRQEQGSRGGFSSTEGGSRSISGVEG